MLGVSRNASMEEITKQYKKLAKQYHPDLHPGEENAAKMSEINAAYETIQAQRSGKTGPSQSGQSYSSGGTYTSYGSGGSQYGDFTSVIILLSAGKYAQAWSLLNSMTERGAQWYYYAAMANYGLGNVMAAVQYASAACSAEPDNPAYRELYEKMTSGAGAYRNESESYGRPRLRIPRSCLWCCLANLACNVLDLFCCPHSSFGGYSGGMFCC